MGSDKIMQSAALGVGGDLVRSLAETLDFVNIQVLRKFYSTGRSFPNDTQPYVFSMLYSEMRDAQRISVGLEALRKRLDFLAAEGLLTKAGGSNPACYHPVKGLEQTIRAVIKRFMLNNGLGSI